MRKPTRKLFFPEKGGSTKDAKRMCGMCPVTEQCLQWALDNGERYGIYGGLSERERRKLMHAQDEDEQDEDEQVAS